MRKIKQIVYKWVEKKYMGGCSNYNSLKTRKNCRSKKQARELFKRINIPHAGGTVFFGFIKPFRFVKEYGFPVCVKPNVSGFSRGSHFPITNNWELLKAILLVKVWWPSSIIEKYLLGKNYRVVVTKNEIMSVIRRYPPFVVGDGMSSISALIERENSIRKKMGLFPVIYPIKQNQMISRYLKKQGLSFESVVEKGKTITLFNRISLAPGGVVEILDKHSMHQDNVDLFLKIIPELDANILGIDAIFEKGIEVSHKDQKAIFLEINSRPYLKMHHHPRFGEKEDLSGYYTLLDSMAVSERDIY